MEIHSKENESALQAHARLVLIMLGLPITPANVKELMEFAKVAYGDGYIYAKEEVESFDLYRKESSNGS